MRPGLLRQDGGLSRVLHAAWRRLSVIGVPLDSPSGLKLDARTHAQCLNMSGSARGLVPIAREGRGTPSAPRRSVLYLVFGPQARVFDTRTAFRLPRSSLCARDSDEGRRGCKNNERKLPYQV